MTKRLVLAAVVVAVAVPCAFARGGLSKWKDWDQSPQGYFMTKVERADWQNVKTDADAEKFVHDFLAKRRDTFATDVADRAAQADKYLTIGKLAGSKTTRGMIVILLGPPQGLDVTAAARSEVKRDNGTMTDALTNFSGTGGGDGGGRGGGGGGTPTVGSAMSTANEVRLYHFTYSGDAAKKVDRSKIDLTVEADANTGKDRLLRSSEANELELIQEQVAQASLKK